MLIGRTGRVTGKVARGLVGEVTLHVRGGAESFAAYPYNPDDVMEVGDRVIVVEDGSIRTVYVAPF